MKDSSSELKTAIASLFLGEGRTEMSEEEIIKSASMKRRWFSPELAGSFIERGLSTGLLIRDGNRLKPSFDCEDMDVPFGYYPDESILEDDSDSGDPDGDTGPGTEYDEYPFVEALKRLMASMKNGEDVREELEKLERDMLRPS